VIYLLYSLIKKGRNGVHALIYILVCLFSRFVFFYFDIMEFLWFRAQTNTIFVPHFFKYVWMSENWIDLFLFGKHMWIDWIHFYDISRMIFRTYRLSRYNTSVCLVWFVEHDHGGCSIQKWSLTCLILWLWMDLDFSFLWIWISSIISGKK
jgi:hypothetical protein